jgi:hypothetical protein
MAQGTRFLNLHLHGTRPTRLQTEVATRLQQNLVFWDYAPVTQRSANFPDRHRLSCSSVRRRNTNGSGEVVREGQARAELSAPFETKPKELPESDH